MRMIDAERLREELLWENVFFTDNEIDALVDLIDNQPTIFPLNDPLTLDELRAMVGNPVYDCLGQVWYIVESYYDHDLIMTDGTHFNDENKYAKVGKRFYCIGPTIPAAQWISVEERLPEEQKEVLIYLPEYDSVEMAALFTIPSMNLREWAQNEDAYMLDEVSYWMPLPEPPEEVRDDGAHIEP